MAVKQKVVECGVQNSPEARIQIILRVLQNVRTHGLPEDTCIQIVNSLGNIQVPADPNSVIPFMSDLNSIKEILAKECLKHDLVFPTLKAMYHEISTSDKPLSPAMSIVLQLIDVEFIPSAVDLILRAGYNNQHLKRALMTLCTWLTKWTQTDNLGPLILALIHGLEQQRCNILFEVTMFSIEPLFKLIILPTHRKSVGPIVLHMLTSHLPQNPDAFLKIVPKISMVVKHLESENSESSLSYLQDIVNATAFLMNHFPQYTNLYEQIKVDLEPYLPVNSKIQALNSKAWLDGSNMIIPIQSNNGKVGLNNLGNTCYMNSILQALFMTKPFRNEILLHNQLMMQLFSKLQDLFALLQHSQKFSLSPMDVLNVARPPGFLPGQQHDSSEFLGYLLDTLHEQERNTYAHNTEESACASSPPTNTTIVQTAFGGRTISYSRCGQCGTKSERVDNFRELQLSFPSNSDNQSVQTLLDYYLQPEKLSGDNQYHCDICEGLTDGERVTCIEEAPPRLILTLKHFRYDPASQQRTKLLQDVKLDRHVQLNESYELYAAVIHCGSSLDSGHYYTLARDGDDWYKFNDCVVTKTATDDLCTLKAPETPYILFYSRQDCLDPDNLPRGLLGQRLQLVINKDNSEFELERKRPLNPYNTRQNNRSNNDEPPPPGCGGGGFGSNATNMYVC